MVIFITDTFIKHAEIAAIGSKEVDTVAQAICDD
jgi:hypothetical protein